MIIDNHVCSAFQRKIGSIDSFLDRFESLEMCKRSIELNNDNMKTLQDLTDRFAILTKILEINSMDLSTQFYRLKQQMSNLNNMNKITETEMVLPVRDLIANSAKTYNYFTPEHNWYTFLVQLYEFLAGYEVQKNITARLSDWGLLNKPQGNTAVPQTPLKLEELNKIIEITLFEFPTQVEYKNSTVTISGNL